MARSERTSLPGYVVPHLVWRESRMGFDMRSLVRRLFIMRASRLELFVIALG